MMFSRFGYTSGLLEKPDQNPRSLTFKENMVKCQ